MANPSKASPVGQAAKIGTNLDVLLLPPVNTFLQLFYEAVALLSVLGPVEQPRTSHLDLGSATETAETTWRKFLDQLSGLCDFKGGGDTVTSIAVQARSDGPAYWIAMNHALQSKAESHLRYVLGELETANRLSTVELKALESRISHKTIELSPSRIHGYGTRLCKLIHDAREPIQINASEAGS